MQIDHCCDSKLMSRPDMVRTPEILPILREDFKVMEVCCVLHEEEKLSRRLEYAI